MFSILIPSFNNLDYLKICLKSIKKNSKFNHQIIIHSNIGSDGTLDFIKDNNYDFTHTIYNSGICEGINKASKLAIFDYYLYAHDDFYFCPNWDVVLLNEIKTIKHNKFYLSGTMMNKGQIPFNCGDNSKNFDEIKFLQNYKRFNFYDFQGSTWAPTLVHKELWNQVGGFSEEFFPGSGSDPDFNMKLWNAGVRIFKGINDFKVYHFGSVVLRKKLKKDNLKQNYGSKGAKLFLLKWGISIKFFKRFYLKSNTRFYSVLENPDKCLIYYLNYFLCRMNYYYLKLFYFK